MNSVLIILAIVLAVYLGYKTKINTGFFCITFAYIIGCFLVGLSLSIFSIHTSLTITPSICRYLLLRCAFSAAFRFAVL